MSANPTPYRILLVDDDPLILQALGRDLEEQGYDVAVAPDGPPAVELLRRRRFDLVMTDLVMDEGDGITVLREAKALHPDILVILLTGFGDLSSAVDALRLDADDFLLKPCEPEELHFRVSRCLEKLELRKRLRIYENLLPVCCVCKKVRDDAGKEPGTGQWTALEDYIRTRARVDVTSTYCPECAEKATRAFTRRDRD